MRTLRLGGALSTSRIAYGCANLGGAWDDSPVGEPALAKGVRAVRAAIDAGIDFFDHADIYCRGKSEQVFARALAELGTARDRILIQSKCGVRFAGDPTPDAPGRYDFSHAHIVASAEGSLRRLGIAHLDVYVLHRPDALVEPEEVARAFDELHRAGKVRWFGVSNHTAGQIERLRRALRQPLVVNQVQLSLVHAHLIDAGIVANQRQPSLGADGTLDYCDLNRITVQAWSPLAAGRAVGSAGDALATTIARIAAAKGASAEAVAVAWLLRHPAGIQPIIGSSDPARIAAIARADQIELTREEWYALLIAGRGAKLP